MITSQLHTKNVTSLGPYLENGDSKSRTILNSILLSTRKTRQIDSALYTKSYVTLPCLSALFISFDKIQTSPVILYKNKLETVLNFTIGNLRLQ